MLNVVGWVGMNHVCGVFLMHGWNQLDDKSPG